MRTSLVLAPMLLAALGSTPAQKVAKLNEELRIDATKEDFSRIGGVIPGPRGLMAVLMYGESQIRLYDSTGRRIVALGRAGAGPGEFRQMSTVGWIGDTVWAYDRSLMRTSFFGTDGRVIRDVPIQKGSLSGATAINGSPLGLYLQPIALYPGGETLVTGLAVPTGAGSRMAKRFYGFMAADGAITRIAGIPNFEDDAYIMVIGTETGYRSVPLVVNPSVPVQPDGSRYGFFVVENSRKGGGVVRVSSYRRDGSREFAKEIPFTGDPVPAKVRDSLIADQIRRRAPGGEGSAARDQQYADMARERIPRFYAAIDGASFGLDGSIWLHRRTTGDRQEYQVLDARGNEIGTLTLPPRTGLSRATLTRAWTIERDADDLPSIVRYRIDWQK